MKTIEELKAVHRDVYEISDTNTATKPNLLIYASCHGRTLMTWLKRRPDVVEKFNLVRIETGPMTLFLSDGVDPFSVHEIKQALATADVVITNNMGARMGAHSLDKAVKRMSAGVKIVTFTAPNFSCLWPFCYGYTGPIGMLNLFDKGIGKEEAWASFLAGDYDPLFHLRWRLEMGRLEDKDGYHDIPLSDFVKDHFRTHKLFMSPTHPSAIPIAYVGSELCQRLGLRAEPLEDILGMDYTLGAVGGIAETNYEWNHYRFEYPQRHIEDAGGMEYYRTVLEHVHGQWLTGKAVIPPPVD